MDLQGDIPDSAVVTFGRGLPGLDAHQFVILKPDGLEPIVMLQSVDNPDIGLPAIPCRSVIAGYEVQLDEDDRAELALADEDVALSLLYLAVLQSGGTDRDQPSKQSRVPNRRRRQPLLDTASARGRLAVLVLSRHAGESLRIGENIEITVLEVRASAVKIGIEARKSVRIFRSELERINRQAAADCQDKVQLTAIAQRLRRKTDTP